jgi:hypothetical protein
MRAEATQKLVRADSRGVRQIGTGQRKEAAVVVSCSPGSPGQPAEEFDLGEKHASQEPDWERPLICPPPAAIRSAEGMNLSSLVGLDVGDAVDDATTDLEVGGPGRASASVPGFCGLSDQRRDSSTWLVPQACRSCKTSSFFIAWGG